MPGFISGISFLLVFCWKFKANIEFYKNDFYVPDLLRVCNCIDFFLPAPLDQRLIKIAIKRSFPNRWRS